MNDSARVREDGVGLHTPEGVGANPTPATISPPPTLLDRFPDDPDTVPPGLSSVEKIDLTVAAAWRNTRREWRAPEEPMPGDDIALWEWLWLGVSFDIVAVADGCDLPVDDATDRLMMLVRLRLIWPNGQVSIWLSRLEASLLTNKTLDVGATSSL